MAEAKDFKFCTQVGPIKYYAGDDKVSLKWVRSWSRDQFLLHYDMLAQY